MAERLDHFMARASAAYYANRDPYVDFTTSPEISQVFGELLGMWAAVTWEGMGCPNRVILAEAGPGRGTLMADALRAIRAVIPGFARALDVHLVETSPRLRTQQSAKIPGATWHDRIEDLPPGLMILLANEFLDALPIRQFARHQDGWRERWVEQTDFLDQPTFESLPPAPVGSIVERCEAALAVTSHLSRRFAKEPGAALFLDYGPERSGFGDSLQALSGGRPVSPLAPPGTADITAHVDFEALATAARAAGGTVFGPIPQGIFLTRLGLFQRTDRLARGRPPAEAMALVSSARRLAEPIRMGRLFKALVLCHSPDMVPAGFES